MHFSVRLNISHCFVCVGALGSELPVIKVIRAIEEQHARTIFKEYMAGSDNPQIQAQVKIYLVRRLITQRNEPPYADLKLVFGMRYEADERGPYDYEVIPIKSQDLADLKDPIEFGFRKLKTPLAAVDFKPAVLAKLEIVFWLTPEGEYIPTYSREFEVVNSILLDEIEKKFHATPDVLNAVRH